MIRDFFLFFIFYSFIGWLWEGLISLIRDHKIVNRGFLNGPYCPIYGVGAILFIFLDKYMSSNLVTLFLIGGLIACILEYLTSYVMEKIFRARWWDYSDKIININGRVCLSGYIAFGVGALIIHFAHQYVAQFVSNMQHTDTLAIVLAVIFALDFISTNQSFARFTRMLKDLQTTLGQGKIIQYIHKGKNKLFAEIEKRTSRVLSYPQRRLMRAFPNYKSSYDKAYNEVLRLYSEAKFKPKQSANARKKSKKILK